MNTPNFLSTRGLSPFICAMCDLPLTPEEILANDGYRPMHAVCRSIWIANQAAQLAKIEKV